MRGHLFASPVQTDVICWRSKTETPSDRSGLRAETCKLSARAISESSCSELQTGVVDAMDLTKSAYAGFKLYEVVPSLTETARIWAGGIVYFAQPFWRRLDDEQKAVLTEAATEGAAYFDELIVADEEASMKLATEGGAKAVEPADPEAWVAGARTVWESMAETVGGMERIELIRSIA